MAGHGTAGDAALVVLLAAVVVWIWRDVRRESRESKFVEEVEVWRRTHSL
jgi:hypothetical protein